MVSTFVATVFCIAVIFAFNNMLPRIFGLVVSHILFMTPRDRQRSVLSIAVRIFTKAIFAGWVTYCSSLFALAGSLIATSYLFPAANLLATGIISFACVVLFYAGQGSKWFKQQRQYIAKLLGLNTTIFYSVLAKEYLAEGGQFDFLLRNIFEGTFYRDRKRAIDAAIKLNKAEQANSDMLVFAVSIPTKDLQRLVSANNAVPHTQFTQEGDLNIITTQARCELRSISTVAVSWYRGNKRPYVNALAKMYKRYQAAPERNIRITFGDRVRISVAGHYVPVDE